jgi:hypothetical protein
VIDVQAQEMIEEIVAWRDVAEHTPDARFALIKKLRIAHAAPLPSRISLRI